MRFNIELDDEDYINFNTFLVFNTQEGRKAIMKGRLLGPAISLLVMVVLLLAKADKWLMITEFCFLAVFATVTFLMYPKTIGKSMRKHILAMKKDGKLPYEAESTLEFKDDEIFEIRHDGERHIPYSDIMSIGEEEDYIYLRKGVQEALVLPKRCLEGKSEELLAFVKSKVTEKDL